MKGISYTLDVLLGSVFLLMLITLVLVSQEPTANEAFFPPYDEAFLNAMKYSGKLAEGITNETSLQELLNQTPDYLCADLTLFQVKKGKDGENDNGDNGKNGDKKDKDGDDDNGGDKDEGGGGGGDGGGDGNGGNDGNGGSGQLNEVFTLIKDGCDFAQTENLTIKTSYVTLVTLKNNGKVDKTYLYRLRTWPKLS